MRVMIANNTGKEAYRLLAAFPDRIGHIYGPGGWRGPWPYYALDNGAFPEWKRGKPFNEDRFLKLCDSAAAAEVKPAWVAVPDVVMDRDATLERWYEWAPRLRSYGFPLAFVVQNGMVGADIPSEASAVFVGGDTAWKRETAAYWCQHHPHVHVGRVNGERDLWRYHRAGAQSCDGTGWFRGDRRQLDGLWYYLADSEGEDDAAHGPMQARLFPTHLKVPGLDLVSR
jgi:hypothetical protein